MELKVGYTLGGQYVQCPVDVPRGIVESKDPAKIAAAVSQAVGGAVLLKWATNVRGDIIVEDTGEAVAPSTATSEIQRPSEEDLIGLAEAANGLEQLREMVAHFGVENAIDYTPGLSATSIANKLIALWYPKETAKKK